MQEIERVVEETCSRGGTLDRATIALLAQAYHTEQLKEKAFEALKFCARKYADVYLQAYFEVVPWDQEALYDAEAFEGIYRFVTEQTGIFRNVEPDVIVAVLHEKPCAVLIFRLILGYSLDEIELVLAKKFGVFFSKDKLREIEQKCHEASPGLLRQWRSDVAPVLSLFFYKTAYGETFAGLEGIPEERFKRRAKVLKLDFSRGWESVFEMASRGVLFADLLYQRYIGGSVRQVLDIGSALKADILEEPVKALLESQRIPFYQTRPRERVGGWEQAPDFFIPNRERPEVVIEAKVAEDGGTARDKASRIERLARIAQAKGAVCIAVVDGKGFRRINDVLVPILVNCKGKVFSYSNLRELLALPEIAQWAGKATF